MLRSTIRPVGDPDTFWHLSAGEYLWSTWSFAGPEPWSTFSTHPWVLHEWLPELLMWAASEVGGLSAVAWLTTAAVTALFVVVYRTCRNRAPVVPSAIAALAGMFGASASFAPRPQLASFILLAIFVGAWLRTCDDGKVRWWLIPLQWIWACSHGLWFVGILLSLVCLAGLAVERRGVASLRRHAVLVLFQGVVCLFTPLGLGLVSVLQRIGGATSLVTEWRASSLHDLNFALTMAAAGLVSLIWARSVRPVRWPHAALLVFAIAWTLLYARTVALGAITLAPLVAMALQSLHEEESLDAVRGERRSLLASVAVTLAVAAMVLPSVARNPEMPNELNRDLDALPRGAVVFNEYSLGGWLLWRHPELEAAIDPRVEVFAASYVVEYQAAESAAAGWREVVTRTRAGYAVLPSHLPLAGALKDDGWSTIAGDAGYVLLKKP